MKYTLFLLLSLTTSILLSMDKYMPVDGFGVLRYYACSPVWKRQFQRTVIIEDRTQWGAPDPLIQQLIITTRTDATPTTEWASVLATLYPNIRQIIFTTAAAEKLTFAQAEEIARKFPLAETYGIDSPFLKSERRVKR